VWRFRGETKVFKRAADGNFPAAGALVAKSRSVERNDILPADFELPAGYKKDDISRTGGQD